MIRKSISVIIIFFTLFSIFSSTYFETVRTHFFPPTELKMFETCYPDLKFKHFYVKELDDWKVEVTKPIRPKSQKTKTQTFFWADCRMLPKENLKEKNIYSKLLYEYEKELKDPKELTEEEIQNLRDYGSTKNRMNSAGTPMFFFDFLYDTYSAKIVETHILKTTFLGKKTKIHERIEKPLRNVERKIFALRKTNKSVQDFLNTLSTTDAYFWRLIANTNRKSFHSYGIAIDCLPKRLYGKQTYWSWAKSKYGDNWMITPLEDRWMPPQKVIEAFESEGFVWGGKWGIWDTMHFEYHPELLKYNGFELNF